MRFQKLSTNHPHLCPSYSSSHRKCMQVFIIYHIFYHIHTSPFLHPYSPTFLPHIPSHHHSYTFTTHKIPSFPVTTTSPFHHHHQIPYPLLIISQFTHHPPLPPSSQAILKQTQTGKKADTRKDSLSSLHHHLSIHHPSITSTNLLDLLESLCVLVVDADPSVRAEVASCFYYFYLIGFLYIFIIIFLFIMFIISCPGLFIWIF